MEYYEHGGGAMASLFWHQESASTCLESGIPTDHWRAEYDDNQALSGTPRMIRGEGNGNFLHYYWRDRGPNVCALGAEHFSVRWTRQVY